MNVTFYNVTKRRNSTKLPTGSGVSYTCLLKDDTSTSRPQIMIKWDGSSGAPAQYNYCYIPAFSRYYWVNSWIYSDRMWVASCSVDVLATFRTQIGSSTKYILRSASDYDPEIIDTIYSPKTVPKVLNATSVGDGFNWARTLAGGTIVVGIIGMRDTVAYSAGGVSYYTCTPADLITLMSQLYTESLSNVDGENYGSSIGDAFKAFSRNLLKSVTNPTQYVKSIQWFPMTFSVGAGVNPIIAGVTSTAILYPLTNPIKSEYATFNFNFAVNDSTDYWKNLEPFARTTAYFPPYGVFNLDRSKFKIGSGGIRCYIQTDAISGLSHILISPLASGQVNLVTIGEAICQVGVPLDYNGIKSGDTSLTGAISTAASAAAGDMIGAAAGTANMISGAMPAVESRGSYGGISGDIADKYVETVYYDVQDEDPAERGKPLCQIKTIGSLSGYVLCADGNVECNATEDEHKSIEVFLTGGFFYE